MKEMSAWDIAEALMNIGVASLIALPIVVASALHQR